VTDHNTQVHGEVATTRVSANTCYVTVAFDDGRRVELEVVDDKKDRPLTPHYIRVRKPRISGRQTAWFQWYQPDDLFVGNQAPSGDITVTVTVQTPERAAPARQEGAAWYFAEVLAEGIDDVLDQELWPKPGETQAGEVSTRAEARRLIDPPTVFGIEVKVWLFADDETSLNLLAKLYLLLDCKHARYPDLWQDLFASRNVRDATPSAFYVTGIVAGRDLDPATIPVRYFAPKVGHDRPYISRPEDSSSA
jgi:hypothetical protein